MEFAATNNNEPAIVVAEILDEEVSKVLVSLVLLQDSSGESADFRARLRVAADRLIDKPPAKIEIGKPEKVIISSVRPVHDPTVEQAITLYLRLRFGGSSKSFAVLYLTWIVEFANACVDQSDTMFFDVVRDEFNRTTELQRAMLSLNGLILEGGDKEEIVYFTDGDVCWVFFDPGTPEQIIIGLESRLFHDRGFQNVFRMTSQTLLGARDQNDLVQIAPPHRDLLNRIYAEVSSYYREEVIPPSGFCKLLSLSEISVFLETAIDPSVSE